MEQGSRRSRSHRHHHRHHHHKHRAGNPQTTTVIENNPSNESVAKESPDDQSIHESLLKVKRIILDLRNQDDTALDELKTQFNLLDNGYSVDLNKIGNSLLQGTLSVIFDILKLPCTNRGFFWNEDDFNGCRISDLLDDSLSLDIATLEDSLKQNDQIQHKENDSNEIDLDALDEEESEDMNYGPALPETVFTKPAVENGNQMVGPMIPDEIAHMLAEGIPVQIENEEEVGPSLPGEEVRKPTAETLQKMEELLVNKENEGKKPKKLERAEWMTLMPDSPFSSAFASVKSRRFANIPAGCKMDPTWAETPEEREKRVKEHLSKTLIGGYKEEPKLTKEQEKEKEKEMQAYFEQYEREHRSETLSEIHQRLSKQKKESKETGDKYSRDAIFKRPARKGRQDADFIQNRGSLKSRFGTVTYNAGSLK